MSRSSLRLLIAAALATSLAGCGLVTQLTGRRNFTAQSDAMAPTLKRGQRFTIRTTDDHYAPKLGDIVIYHPKQWPGMEGEYVSRVIGVPGSTVRCCDDGRVVVNGQQLSEPYVSANPASARDFDISVPRGRIWIMGDNRDVSLDSRAHQGDLGSGTIAITDVTGIVESSK
ncbi:signal peptidase I [Nonomuraea sediminis]|uniref:signal peptidase I n=1 Tax=Nonomuraea sediminis TaxID=2835864 RepID=UPI001BDCEEA9|nr:signal peptidase I [Nonomuraea sediminis]